MVLFSFVVFASFFRFSSVQSCALDFFVLFDLKLWSSFVIISDLVCAVLFSGRSRLFLNVWVPIRGSYFCSIFARGFKVGVSRHNSSLS